MKARYLKTTAVLILSAVLLTVGLSLTPAADLLCELSITANAQGEITSISSVSEWNSFANSVNNGATYEGVTVTLNSDISGVTTTVGTETNTFKGTFDGNHKTLSVSINDTSAQGTAPFRYIADATIKDLTVKGTVTGTTHAAGLVGFNWSGSSLIENCVVNTSVSVTTGENMHMGGVVGHGKTAALTIELKNVVKALYKYSQAADSYFNVS